MSDTTVVSTRSIGERATRGVALMSAQTVAAKVASSLGQLVLAALLLDDDFGIVAIAFAIRAFALIIQQVGIREVLISKQDRIDRWTNAAFWLGLVLGIASMAIMAVAAYPVSIALEEPQLVGVTLVLLLAQPANAFLAISNAVIERRLLYKTVALAEGTSAILQVISMITFAALGAGAYSFAIGVVVAMWYKVIVLTTVAKPRIRRRLDLHRWPTFISAALPMTGAAALEKILHQADYAILAALTLSGSMVGQYFFAFNQSTATGQLFVWSLVRVLLSGLSTMIGEPKRQVAAYLRAVRLVAILAVPAGITQAVIARPLLTLLFADKWAAAIPLLEILSVLAGLAAGAWTNQSLLLAQQRYATRFRLRLWGAIAYVPIVSTAGYLGLQTQGTAFGAALGVALGVGLFNIVYTPIAIWIACRPARTTMTHILAILGTPFFGSAITIIPLALATRAALNASGVEGWQSHAAQITSGAVLSPLAFWCWCKLAQREDLKQLGIQFQRVAPRRLFRYVPNWIF